jgi:hypothetical protein
MWVASGDMIIEPWQEQGQTPRLLAGPGMRLSSGAISEGPQISW